MTKKLNWLLAGAALTLVAGAAVAADKKDDKDERRVERHVHVYRGGPGDVRVIRHNGGPEARAEHLKTMLQLKPNQEGALKTYLEAMRPDEDHFVRIEHRDGETSTTPERLDRMEKRMAERQAEMKKRNNATRAFYAQLDASQKKVFDTMPHIVGGPGRMAMMGHPMPGMHRMPLPPMPPIAPGAPMPPAPPEPRD